MPIPDRPFVFVSYSSKDASFVHSEVRRLELQGYIVWYDQGELLPARFWAEEIRKAIAACACFIVFITEDSVVSDNVCDEVDQALKADKPLVGIYWDDVELPAHLQALVRSRQTLDLHSLHLSTYQELLRKALSEYVGWSRPLGSAADTKVDVVPAISAPGAALNMLPKVLFFSLVLLVILCLVFTVVVSIVPFLVTARPDDIINNRFMAASLAVFLMGIAVVLTGIAFAVFRIYLRKRR